MEYFYNKPEGNNWQRVVCKSEKSAEDIVILFKGMNHLIKGAVGGDLLSWSTRNLLNTNGIYSQFIRRIRSERRLVSSRIKGTPQGSPLLPLLSKIVLYEPDIELERLCYQFVGSDGFSIFN